MRNGKKKNLQQFKLIKIAAPLKPDFKFGSGVLLIVRAECLFDDDSIPVLYFKSFSSLSVTGSQQASAVVNQAAPVHNKNEFPLQTVPNTIPVTAILVSVSNNETFQK